MADALLSEADGGGGGDESVFATSAREISPSSISRSSPLGTSKLVVVAPDLRGHGATKAEEETDLSIETLLRDVETLYATHLAHRFGDVVLVGWSMGAAVAIKLASLAGSVLASRVVGLVAIDVVEGTAMEALKSMAAILAIRPKGFDSVEQAVEWAVSSGTARRRESAEISVPGMLIEAGPSDIVGEASTHGYGSQPSATTARAGKMGPPPPIPRYPGIAEENGPSEEKETDGKERKDVKEVKKFKDGGERRGDGPNPPGAKPPYKYVWRVALERTEPFWAGWFRGLSQAFLEVSAPKLLLLAGHDRLDKTLTIAQMQGKFQMAVVPRAGHAIHEDQPRAVADKIWGFLCRHLAKRSVF